MHLFVKKNMNCRPHERKWDGRCVDKGIRDEWLVCMNGLEHFHPYSSCEGHVSQTGEGWSDHARIFLSIESVAFISRLKRIWKHHEPAFQSLAAQFFPHNQTTVVLRLGSMVLGGEGLDLHLDSVIRRESEDMPQPVIQWFESTTKAFSQFESAFVQKMEALS